MDKNYKCCDGNGDARGLCFICIGDMDNMTAKTILEVRKCPNKNYAIAYWIYNNHNEELEKNWLKKFMGIDELSLLEPDWRYVSNHIRGFEIDDDEDTDDDENEDTNDDENEDTNDDD